MKTRLSILSILLGLCFFVYSSCDMVPDPFSADSEKRQASEEVELIPVFTTTRFGGPITHSGNVTENMLNIISRNGNNGSSFTIQGEFAGLFAIAWRQKGDELLGGARASAFGNGATDMGDVTLKYAAQETPLFKIVTTYPTTGFQSIRYSTVNEQTSPPTRREVPFVSSTTYRFEASGSSGFSPLTIEFEGPDELLSITSPNEGEIISSDTPLTIEWQGEHPTLLPSLKVYPLLWHEDWQELSQAYDGTIPEEVKPITRSLNQNTVTISTGQLEMLRNKGGAGLVIQISRDVVHRVKHDGKTFYAVFRDTTPTLGLYFQPF